MNKLTFSVLLVALCASACLARTSPQVRRPFKFAPGQTYVYEYHGRQWNGLTKMADQYSGIDVACDVILQALPESQGKEVLMKLDAIKVEQLHTQALENNDIRKLNQGKEVDQRQMSLYKEQLAKPIRFTYLEGKIVRFVAEQSEPEWSINLKKSVLSLFQLDLAPTKIIKSSRKQIDEQIYGQTPAEEMIRGAQEMPLVYPIYEESFGGICETLYELDSVDNVEQRDSQRDFYNEVLNVTKTVNYKNCLTDPSVSYDSHSFKVNTQTAKGRLFAKQPSFASTQFYPVPEELKQKYSNAYNSFDGQNNVASPVPVERHSYTKYNLTTAPQSSVFTSSSRRSLMSQIPADLLVIEGVYSEGKIKYEAEGDLLVSDTQQTLKLVSCVPSVELARLAPEIQAVQVVEPRQPVEYQTIQCELSSQKLKFYQALQKFSQLKQQQQLIGSTYRTAQQPQQLFNHQLVLPFALSASWYPMVATGEQSAEQSLERLVEPERLGKEFENLLMSLAEDVLSEDVAASKKAGEKVVRIVNTVAFLPKYKLAQVYESIVGQLQQAKQQQVQAQQRAQQQKPTFMVDNDVSAKLKIVRKLYLDSLPLAGTKHAIEMIEYLIESQRIKTSEAKELCEAVPAHLRYPDTEIIDAFIRISQLPQVRKSRALFASCSIAVGKMIGQSYAKTQDASYKPTTYESADTLPAHLREDDLVKQVVAEADPRRQLPINWNQAPIEQQLFERLVLDEQDLIKYVKLYKQMLGKAQSYHDKVIYIETLAHMRAPQVLPILEPFATGRLSLGQCLGNQPLDINRPVEQSQWYNYYSRNTFQQQPQQQQQPEIQSTRKDWSEEASFAAEECNYMRTIAIYAMAHVARVSPNKVQALLLPVFDNTYEPYQIRIAAFTTMMLTKLDEHLLERVASQMWREPSKEVASFVVGAIDTMSKMTAPKLAPFKIAALKAKDSMPKQFLDTWRFSWMAGGDHFNWQKQTGLSWLAEVIKSNVSSIPRAAYLHVGRFHGPTGNKFDNHLEMGFTSKGLESLLKEYLNYNKQQELETGEFNIVASIFENLYSAKDDIVKYYRQARDQLKGDLLWETNQKKLDDGESASFSSNYFFKRQQPIDGVNSDQLAKPASRSPKHLFEAGSRTKRSITLQARTSNDDDEEAKLTLFTKIFDATSYHALDKRQLLQLLERADDYVKQAAEELIMGGKIHYVKMIMPSSMWHMVPSQIGLPMIVTHRKPIVASIKIDATQNGQLTSSAVAQYLRQQVQGDGNTVQNKLGQNFATLEGLNITALVHPKIMHSDLRFMFSVDQSVEKTYGVQVERSHQVSLPVEVSVAYSRAKQLVSLSAEPKTPNRVSWVKEAAKTFVAPLCLGTSDAQNWLGDEQLVRSPSQQSQYKRLQRRESFVPSIISGVQSLIQEPKEAQLAAIDELETPYKFEHLFLQKPLGLGLFVEGVSDDEDVVRSMTKPELRKQTRGPMQWSKVEDADDLDQHSRSGPMGEFLHVLDSANNRQSKYLEFYTTIQPDQPHKSPVYRVDFQLNDKVKQQLDKPSKIYQAAIMAQQQPEQQIMMGRRVQQQMPASPIEKQQQIWQTIEQAKRLNKIQKQQEKQIQQIQQQQQIMLEAY